MKLALMAALFCCGCTHYYDTAKEFASVVESWNLAGLKSKEVKLKLSNRGFLCNNNICTRKAGASNFVCDQTQTIKLITDVFDIVVRLDIPTVRDELPSTCL